MEIQLQTRLEFLFFVLYHNTHHFFTCHSSVQESVANQLTATLVSLQPRINLSPFTKDFRGEEHYNESID